MKDKLLKLLKEALTDTAELEDELLQNNGHSVLAVELLKLRLKYNPVSFVNNYPISQREVLSK